MAIKKVGIGREYPGVRPPQQRTPWILYQAGASGSTYHLAAQIPSTHYPSASIRSQKRGLLGSFEESTIPVPRTRTGQTSSQGESSREPSNLSRRPSNPLDGRRRTSRHTCAGELEGEHSSLSDQITGPSLHSREESIGIHFPEEKHPREQGSNSIRSFTRRSIELTNLGSGRARADDLQNHDRGTKRGET